MNYDPTPRLHVHPTSGWLNDPHGALWNAGRYHLFYQHNPDAPEWGNIQWAHVSSTDLVRWSEHPIALRTRPHGPDAAVCSTGAVTVDDGAPVIAYTATVDASGIGPVVLARPLDDELDHWEQGTEPAVAASPLPGPTRGFRDPYFFESHGHRWAVMTGGDIDGPPVVLLYECDDITRWCYRGVLLSGTDPVAQRFAPATLWECPQLFPVADRWVLVMSLWTDNQLGDVAYLVGSLEGEGSLVFQPTSGGLVDHGTDFYAPSVHVDGVYRRLWAWSWDSDDPESRAARGTTGALTFPRVVSLASDHLRIEPDAAIDLLRVDGSRREHSWEAVPGSTTDLGALPEMVDILISLPPGVEIEVSWLQRSTGEVASVRVSPTRAAFERAAFPAHPVSRPERAAALAEPAHQLRLLLDHSMCEIFVGGVSFTERIYPTVEDSRHLVVSVLGYSEVRSGTLVAQVWELSQ